MTVTALSSEVFDQDAGSAMKATKHGPVFITGRGQSTYVLLSIEEYSRLTGKQPSMAGLLAMPDDDAGDFDPPHLCGRLRGKGRVR